MTRKQKLLLNSTMSLTHQGIALICGFILPRIFLITYGSAVNGLVASISQFLGFISFCELGVGAVVQSALYKPLAEKNAEEISKITISAERFFRKIAYILLVYTIVLMLILPLKTIDDFGYGYTLFLVVVMSISTFSQYYFGITYQLILAADQLGFIHLSIHSITLILNTVTCAILVHFGASIHFVKLITALFFLVRPISLSFIAKRRYNINRKIELKEEPIKQKWNGLAQHIAAVVLNNTDVVVLTLFSTLQNVSIYAVYNLIVGGVKEVVRSLTNGIQALFGNMLAKREIDQLNDSFDFFEWLMHTVVTLVFSATALLILPFVSVYTIGVTDTNYIVPVFAYLLVIATASYCLRLPYNIMVLAAGHYKQTQCSAIIEATLNIVISIVTVFKFGLIGVALGTLIAMVYRTCYFAWYLSKNIINRNIGIFIKHLLVDAIVVSITVLAYNVRRSYFVLGDLTYIAWVILALKVCGLCFLASVLTNMVFYRKFLKKIAYGFFRKIVKK